MKRKKFVCRLCAGIWGILCVAGCTGHFQDINTDKSGMTEEDMRIDYNFLRIPLDVAQQGIYFNYDFGKGKNWPYQIMQNLNADMFCGYMMDFKPLNGGTNNSDYNLQDGWNGTNWLYTFAYTLPQLKKAEDSTRVDYPALYGVVKILKVETMHRISDIYGPIVYRSFGQEGGNCTPDTQQEAYSQFFADLDTAIELLSNPYPDVDEVVLEKSDIILDGNFATWAKFANSLRMRLAMRLSMIDPGKARTEFLKALESPLGIFESAGDIAIVSTDKGYLNPLGEINRVWGEVQMNASMESILNGYGDPRRSFYFEPCAANTTYTDAKGNTVVVPLKGIYKGVRQGTGFSHLLYANHSKTYVSQKTAPILMTAAEVWFLRAEAALRGWTTESVEACYRQGVATSFNQWKVTTGVDEYLDSGAAAADYVDAFDPANNISARCNVSPRWEENASNEEKLEKIMTQKWLAIFPEGCEAWTEQRRTGYPRLFPVRFNNSKGGAIDTEIMIRRLNFPSDMIDSDPQQYQALVQALGGADDGGTRLWWDTGKNF